MAMTDNDTTSQARTYRLSKEPIKPWEWEQHETHYYRHRETGRTIHEESYYTKVEERKTLAEYLEGFAYRPEEAPPE